MQVTTNIGHEFLKAIDECFPPGSALRSVFNKNNVKLSYSCLPNIQARINAHNKKIKYPKEIRKKSCNCQKSRQCPLEKDCQQQNVVYQATVTSEKPLKKKTGNTQTYIGMASDIKARIANHEQTFKNESQRYTTELSKYIWSLKNEKIKYNTKWKILGRATSYSNATKRCNLCLLEKWYIICKREMATLNKKNELVSCCPHAGKFLLKNTAIS